MKNELQKEILRMTHESAWAFNNIDKLVAEGMSMIEKGTAKTLDQAAFKIIDSYY